MSDLRFEARASEYLLEIGLTANLKGFAYLRRAILIAAEDEHAIYRITKQIYPAIAEEYHVNTICVERAMRHAIEKAWNHHTEAVLYHFFGNSISEFKGKPTNSEFIAMIADRIRLQRKVKA